MTSHPIDADVAAWMVEELGRKDHLYQEQAAWDIQRKFGRSFVYDNENGNPAISKSVLKHFNALTKDNVVWSRSERFWRTREANDKPGRMQD